MIPTVNDVQAVEPILTNLLVGYLQADDRFVAGRVFPSVPVDKDSGTYYVVTKKYFFFDALKPRAAGGEFSRIDYGLETATYKTLQYAADHALPDEIRANSQVPMDLETAALRLFAQTSLIRKEVAFSADFMKTSVWGTDKTGATKWSDGGTSSDPIGDVMLGVRTIGNNTGIEANTMVMGRIVRDRLMVHSDILDRLKYTTAATELAVEQAMAAIFGVKNFWVAKATYSNTNESATFSASAIIDDDVLICAVNPQAGVYDATAGKTFTWGPGGGLGSVYALYDGSRHAAVLQHKEQWDQKAVATDLGYFISDITD